MIIDLTYFTGKLTLPQIGNPGGVTEVERYMALYEPEYLQCVLGYDLWKALSEALEDSAPEQRWIDLAEGKEYTYKSCTDKWNGFENDLKVSPIANYVFYQYVDNKATDLTLTGNVMSKTDNNRTVNGVDRLVDAWNRMVDMNIKLRRFLYANKSVYPEWNINCQHYDSCNCSCNKDYRNCNLFRKINSLDL